MLRSESPSQDQWILSPLLPVVTGHRRMATERHLPGRRYRPDAKRLAMSPSLIIRGLVRRAAIAVAFGTGLLAVTQSTTTGAPDSPIALTSAKFPNLTHAERVVWSSIGSN